MVHIETYEPKYKNDFIRLNKEWIESYFKIESSVRGDLLLPA